jgi:antitoxin ParD1/3/4
MTIQLTPDHEQIVQAKLQSGQYKNAEEVLSMALKLLEAHEAGEAEWLESIRPKINAAYANTEPPVELSTAISQIRQRLHASKHR